MNPFKKKPISQRINKKWKTKTCSLSQLETILAEDDIIDIWVQYHDIYFQIGSSSDCNKKGFFNKSYYINLSTDLSLFKLLNNIVADNGFFFAKDIPTLFNTEMVDGKPLVDIWQHCVMVAVDEMCPSNYLKI